MWQTQQQQKR